MINECQIKEIFESKTTLEGAGVKLKRAFGFNKAKLFDPFLLLDFFGSNTPEDYLAGFPWHPHRGIETITYVLNGEIHHEDSLGNKGIIKSGGVQWMTAGSGIIHEEMPKKVNGLLRGFQLWTNLPAESKMMHPRYRDILKEQIPESTVNEKVKIKIISGEFNGLKGPVQDIIIEPQFFDVSIKANGQFELSVKAVHTVFAFIYEGEGYFDSNQKKPIKQGQCVLYNKGEKIVISTKNKSVQFLLVSGTPIKEPIAWYGPIVMNTEQELKLALREYRNETFIKHS